MSNGKIVLIVEENSFIPIDTRVWYEVTTLRDAGWQPVVICPAPVSFHSFKAASVTFGEPVDIEGITVYYFLLKVAERGVISYLVEYLSALWSITRLSWRVWRRTHFDIIHLCNPPDILFFLGILYRLLGARVVFDHHDLFPELIAHRYRGLIGRVLYSTAKVMEFLTFRTAHITISTNLSYRQIAMERGKVSSDDVLVVRNGPKVADFIPTQPDPSLKQGLKYMVCYAGVMGHEDGVQELLESIHYIICDLGRRDILFTLLGDGAIRLQSQLTVNKWGFSAFVHFPGMIRDKELLRRYLCTADVCVSPEPLTPLNGYSTFIKVAEYMAMGKPVVASDLKETRYTAQEAALYVEPGNTKAFGQAIVTLLNDAKLCDQMGKIGRQRILDQLSWEHQQQNLFRAYELALDHK
jgi:glycosyltransferase involved in cell wall biosynthesis